MRDDGVGRVEDIVRDSFESFSAKNEDQCVTDAY
jgi:hypothetical protein